MIRGVAEVNLHAGGLQGIQSNQAFHRNCSKSEISSDILKIIARDQKFWFKIQKMLDKIELISMETVCNLLPSCFMAI